MPDGTKISSRNGITQRIRVMVVYILVLVASTMGIELVKLVISGATGPTSRFICWCVIAPCALVALGFWFGRISGLVSHALALILLGLTVFLTWPSDPVMDFQRQLVSEMKFPLMLTFATCGLFIKRKVI